MADYEDPGWRAAIRTLISIVGWFIARRIRSNDGLTATRIVFLALIAALFLFVVALSYVSAWDGGEERWVPWAVVVIGVISLVAVAHIRRRSLNLDSPQTLAVSDQSAFFAGIGFAHAPALFGVAGVFVGGSL